VPELDLVAVASRTPEKAADYARRFGCDGVTGYDRLLARPDVDCIYMALPTGLHPEWVTKSLAAGKHVLAEKSFAPDLASTTRLVELARSRNLLVTENFSFHLHSQFAWFREQIAGGAVGSVHLFRGNFSFPPLKAGNFRYDAALGGGARLDAGAYMVKVSRLFLGDEMRLVGAALRHDPALGVDVEGTATFAASKGAVAQVAFGFNSFYQCNWEVIGTTGKLTIDRAYTPPPAFSPAARLERQNIRQEFTLPADNHYRNKLIDLVGGIRTEAGYSRYWDDLVQQARHLESIRQNAISL